MEQFIQEVDRRAMPCGYLQTPSSYRNECIEAEGKRDGKKDG